MRIEVIKKELCFFDSYKQKEILKSIGARFNSNGKFWYLPLEKKSLENTLSSFPDFNIDRFFKMINEETVVEEIEDDEIHNIDFNIRILYKHQKKSVAKALRTNFFADLSEPGSGKTLTQIELILQRDVWPVLIICPISLIHDVWHRDLSRNTHGKSIVVLDKGRTKNKEMIKKQRYADIFLINYDSVSMIEAELINIGFEYIILDESTKIKNHAAKRSKSIIRLGENIKYKSIMTGTIAPNGILDMFNQFLFLSKSIFGYSFYSFRERYLLKINDFLWIPKSDSSIIIKNRIKNISIQHAKRDCVDLPPLMHFYRKLEMPVETRKVYDKAKDELILELSTGELLPLAFAATKMIKLRQISSGFFYRKKEEGLDQEVEHLSDYKIEEISDLIEQINNKVIIFTNFIWMAKRLHEVLSKNYSVYLFGNKNKNEEIENFRNDTENSIFIANPKSAGHGLNLQFCSDIIYAEHDFDYETYYQSLMRIERIGQQNKMSVYHILTKKSIDEYIIKKLEKKENDNKLLNINELKNEI